MLAVDDPGYANKYGGDDLPQGNQPAEIRELRKTGEPTSNRPMFPPIAVTSQALLNAPREDSQYLVPDTRATRKRGE